jgi:hypothetical protein
MDATPSPVWIRRSAYLKKYMVGSTTFNKWDNEGRVRTMRIGNLKFAEDRLPTPDSTNEQSLKS